MYKDGIEYSVDTCKRVLQRKKERRHDGFNLFPVSFHHSQKFNDHSHFSCILHIFFRDIRDAFCIDVLKVNLLP